MLLKKKKPLKLKKIFFIQIIQEFVLIAKNYLFYSFSANGTPYFSSRLNF